MVLMVVVGEERRQQWTDNGPVTLALEQLRERTNKRQRGQMDGYATLAHRLKLQDSIGSNKIVTSRSINMGNLNLSGASRFVPNSKLQEVRLDNTCKGSNAFL